MKQKLLALTLALTTLLGLLSPTLAAESPYFTDEKEIEHLEAVTNLVRLGVIHGKEDGGYFDPTGSVTRAEAAKCMAYILNGGEDIPDPLPAQPSFPDIKGHWAEAWIESCAGKGVAFAQENGNFDPNDLVTCFELLRMAEIALGEAPEQYAKSEDWIELTHSVALYMGLFAGLESYTDGKPIPDHPLTRDETAQILYNALNATPKVMTPNGFYQDAKRPDSTPSTLLYENFDYDSWDDVPGLSVISNQPQPERKPKVTVDPTAFSDAKDIAHWEAVAALSQLGIINGKDDGSFDPAGNVTRAEAAKMICVLMNGGSEANTGVKKEPSFSDIQGHWAEDWIEYCADMHIVNGAGDGTFNPDGEVSVVQFYKMALTALGYDPEAYALMGSKWADNTLERARNTNGRKLTEGLPNDGLDGTDSDQPASRETAAQILYNALLATPMTTVPSGVNDDGRVIWQFKPAEGDTLLRQRFNLKAMPDIPAQPTT